ncbi:hypothetical protein IT400_02700 [Candidatus Nomurabacteria bacterium]|nr:hypothetical protein [Candidatus Nomurabacteria bacterium]
MNKNNTIISIIVIIVAIVLGYLLFKYFPKTNDEVVSPIQQLDTQTQTDTTTSIDENLNSIDTNASTDADLKAIDTELNNL